MGETKHSVIIVGAGHIGIACAHYLERDGFDVTVIDQDDIGGGCSQGNCGLLSPSHVLPLTTPASLRAGMKSLLQPGAAFRVKPQLRWALYRWLFQFSRRCTERRMLDAAGVLKAILDVSIDEYRELLSDPSIECDWHDDGLLFVFRSEGALRGFAETDARICADLDVDARFIAGSELPAYDAALREDLAGGYYFANDGYLRPDRLNTAWSRQLTERGVSFIEHCKLEGIEKSAGKISALLTDRGRMTADRYVFATGAWSGKLSRDLECDIPVEPGKGYSVTMTRPEIVPTYPMIFEEAHIAVTPFSDGYRIGSMMEFAGFDDSIPAHRIRKLQDSAEPFLKCPAGSHIEETWYGWRPMTWDSLPIVGRVPRLSNALLATGHNMLGMTLAPVTGKLIADLVAERPTALPVDALSPTRFS